jgi:hypothetical protein
VTSSVPSYRWDAGVVGLFIPACGPGVGTINIRGGAVAKQRELYVRRVRRILTWGMYRLRNNNGFLRNAPQAAKHGRAIRCGASAYGSHEIQVQFGRHPDAAGCGLRGHGARA